jgi:hypothetical protein
MDVLPAEAVANATERYGSAGDEVSYRRLADDSGQSWLDIRQAVERVKAAPAAPHAQFCAFYPHVDAQIEILPAAGTLAAGDVDVEHVRALLRAGG